VLIVALMIVALVAAMAYMMMARLERDTRRTTLILQNTQAELYASRSVVWAIAQLHQNWEQQAPKQIVDKMPCHLPEVTENGYRIATDIEDMQGRFNINNLTLPDADADFKRMLNALMPSLSPQQITKLTQAIQEWVAPGHDRNASSHYYLNLPIPYRAAHKPMVSITELRLVRGMTPAIYNVLKPYVAALPPPTAINIQTAAAPVLMTLGNSLTLETGKIIEAARKGLPAQTIDALNNLDIIKNHPVTPEKLVFISSYFLVKTVVSIEKQHIVFYTLLTRRTDGQHIAVQVVWQSKGSE